MDTVYIIVAILCIVAGFTGGAYKHLKWAAGLMLGLALTPVLETKVLEMLAQSGISGLITPSGIRETTSTFIISRVSSFIAFAVIFLVARLIVNIFLPAPPEGPLFKTIDGVFGVIMRLLLFMVFLWFIAYVNSISVYSYITGWCMQSKIMTVLNQFNPFTGLLAPLKGAFHL